ncbi:MAG: hypothetical protein J7518_12855 [Nocardioidaceae bacterium]|nr:hypothetical protein [Nocardioidaceae bacterium]
MRKAVSGAAVLALTLTVLLIVAPAEAAVRYTVSVAASASRADVGQSVVLRGGVSPNAKGQRVLVQRRVGVSWVTVARPVLSRKSRYAASVRIATGGTNLFRVLKTRSNGHLAGVSKAVAITGWRWRALHTLPLYQPATNMVVLSSAQFGPSLYPSTFRPVIRLGSPAGNVGNVTYRLDNKCTVLDAHIGVTVDSVSAGDQLVNAGVVTKDGFKQILGRWITVNEDPAHVVRSGTVITQAIALNFEGAVQSANTFVGIGAAKVYCAS